MEELIATVPERGTADYLREAFVCYGAGAYRACVVLTHTALFEGLRGKLHAIAPVNKAARDVLAAIEPEVNSQNVFESKLIDKMRIAQIITKLESDILQQLNKQRNKAAHPSGHLVTAEEARFVFAEAITKFLSQPIRQTSVLVESISTRLNDRNFFPSSQIPEIRLVVDQEIENLDSLALPLLISKLVDAINGPEKTAACNGVLFLRGLAAARALTMREHIIKHFITPQASVGLDHAQIIVELISLDPEILGSLPAATRLRVKPLLTANVSKSALYGELRNPARILAAMVLGLGEEFVLSNFKNYSDEVIESAPTSPDFIKALKNAPALGASLQERYRLEAGHNDFGRTNAFSENLPSIDAALADISTDENAFRLIAIVIRAARGNAYGAMDLANAKFKALTFLKSKALAFITDAPDAASMIIGDYGYHQGLAKFKEIYFDELNSEVVPGIVC